MSNPSRRTAAALLIAAAALACGAPANATAPADAAGARAQAKPTEKRAKTKKKQRPVSARVKKPISRKKVAREVRATRANGTPGPFLHATAQYFPQGGAGTWSAHQAQLEIWEETGRALRKRVDARDLVTGEQRSIFDTPELRLFITLPKGVTSATDPRARADFFRWCRPIVLRSQLADAATVRAQWATLTTGPAVDGRATKLGSVAYDAIAPPGAPVTPLREDYLLDAETQLPLRSTEGLAGSTAPYAHTDYSTWETPALLTDAELEPAALPASIVTWDDAGQPGCIDN